MRQAIISATLTAMMAWPAGAQTIDEQTFQRIVAEVYEPVIREHDIPGMAIGVTIGGEHHFFTDGLAIRQGEVPVTTDTIFELGSVSKLFNVALAALAEQQGLLALSDPVSQHLPGLAGSAFDRITLSDLAAHANGGLPLQVPDEITDHAGLTAYLADWAPDVDTKRLRSYSNLSIGLLGLITGERMCQSYEVALADCLLPGLGMDSTFIEVPQGAAGRYAFGYAADDGAVRVNPGMLDAEAYGVKSTVADMVRFLDAHLGQVATDEKLAAALARTRKAEFDTKYFAQGMIWEGYPWPTDATRLRDGNSPEISTKGQPMVPKDMPADMSHGMLLSKTGSTNGFGAYVAMVPDQDIGIVVLANRNYPNPVRVTAGLDLIERLLAARGE